MGSDDASALTIRLFDPFEARLNREPLPRLRFRKSQAVLALLALRGGREVERDWLATLLWPETAPFAARHGLRKCLTDLRQALGPEAVRLRSPTSRTLCLDLTGAFVDVLAYDAAIARDDLHFQAEAVALYRGRLLEGWAEEWVFEERQAREQAYLLALERLAALALERGAGGAEGRVPVGGGGEANSSAATQGGGAEAERLLRLAVAADPLRESARRALMAVLAGGGCYAAALRTYQELRQHLHRELNAEPDPKTQALFEQIRAEARGKARRGSASLDSGFQPAAGSRHWSEAGGSQPDRAGGVPRAVSGEIRLVTVLFADMSRSVEQTSGLPPDEGAELVNGLLSAMVDVVLRYGGRVDRFLGDGLLAAFGVPEAHEDDPERAIRAALEIRTAARRLGQEVTAGINTGEVYVGALGSEKHREMTVVGPVVSLGSRLQAHAAPGGILVGEATYRLARRAFEFSPVQLAVQGVPEPAVVYSVIRGLARPEKARGIEGLRSPLIGREEELAKLRGVLSRLLGSAAPGAGGALGQIVSLIAEAGVGKSRLIAELKAAATPDRPPSRDREGAEGAAEQRLLPHGHSALLSLPHGRGSDKLLWLEGRCLELAATNRYSLFVDLLRHYFAWPVDTDEAGRVARIVAVLREGVSRGALAANRADEIGPLLADLFSVRWGDDGDLQIQDTDPEQHKQRTFFAIRDFLLALAWQQPLVLVLEDLHWADSLSLDLIALLMESLMQAPLLLLCSYRPDQESTRSAGGGTRAWSGAASRAGARSAGPVPGPGSRGCSRLGTLAAQKCPESFIELRLRELTPRQSQQLVAALLGTRELPPPVKELIVDRSRGNPFFMEELVHSLVERGVLYQEEAGIIGEEGTRAQRGSGAWRVRDEPARRPVPESVQGVILSRVDRLEPELKEVLQHAAIIGRVFDRRLLEKTVDSGQWLVDSSDKVDSARRLSTNHYPLSAALWELEERGLIYQERVIPQEEYSFRHVLVQETVYEGILRSRRAGLHRQVAEAIESLHSERLDAYYERLAFHYEQASLPRLGAGSGTGGCPDVSGLVPASGAVGATEANQQRALDYLIRAAERAHRTAAHREEAALLTRAIGMAERLGEHDRIPDLRARRGGALARVGAYPEARADLEAALAGLAADRLAERAEVLADLCTVSFWGLDAPGLRRYAPQALAVAEAAGRDDLAAGATAWLAETVRIEGKLGSARDLYRRATVRAGGIRVAPIAGFPMVLYQLGQIPEAVETGRKALEAARGTNDTLFTMYALSHLGLALGASGRYGEAMQMFAEARQFGQEYDVGPFLARAIAMSAGLHLDVFDFSGNEALAEEVRDLPRSGAFPPSVVSAGIDLLLNFARRQEVSRAERLVDEVARAAQDEKLAERHGWQWKMRLPQARAEIALARADWSEAARWADEAIAQSRATGRVKYQVLGLGARGKALAGLGRKREGIAALQEAVTLARPVGDPAMFLRAATALLELEGDGNLAAEARAAAKRIAAALPDEPMRRRFEAAEPVRLLGGLD